MKNLLCINPWIYDFAAFDFWMKPAGLLYLAAHFRQAGYQVHLVDCLDRHNHLLLQRQKLQAPRNRAYGTGKFLREALDKPEILRHIPENYCRYGIPEDIFIDMLDAVPHPDAILVTSMMTYWYPGVFRAIELARQRYPKSPIILGGVYATLCPQHARSFSGADYVLTDHAPAVLLQAVRDIVGPTSSEPPPPADFFEVYPAFDLYPHLDYACLLTSIGCPYQCTYCASQVLSPQFVQRNSHDVFQEVCTEYETLGIRHFAFYDDALLIRSKEHLNPFLQTVIEAGLDCTFHTPNGLHARHLTEETAHLLFRSGFKTIRLGLETINPTRQRQTGAKVTGDELVHAVECLKRAGFEGHQIGIYLFIGLPGQTLAETRETIQNVHTLNVQAHLCEYSPIPGTPAWKLLEQQGLVCSDDDPLLHNNSIFLFQNRRFSFDQMQHLKNWVRTLNQRIKQDTSQQLLMM